MVSHYSTLVIIFLLGTQTLGGILTSSFDPKACIEAGSSVTIDCTVEDLHQGQGGTVWTGSPSIFDCPNAFSLLNNQIFLCHQNEFLCSEEDRVNGTLVGTCGPSVCAQLYSTNRTHYVSTLTIQNTTVAMDGGSIECIGSDSVIGELMLMIGVIPPPPTLQRVKFSENSFTIYWNETQGGIDEYRTGANGECGECNTLGLEDRQNNTLSCSGWTPNGQVCTVTVTAIISRCPEFENQTSPLLVSISLQYPQEPRFLSVIPVYSVQEQLLRSIRMNVSFSQRVTSESMQDNILTVTNRIELKNIDNSELNCTKQIDWSPASNYHNFYVEIILLQDCPNLLQQQQGEYSLTAYAKNSIGETPNEYYQLINYTADLKLNIINTSSSAKLNITFKDDSITGSSIDVIYGPNCTGLIYSGIRWNATNKQSVSYFLPSANYSGDFCLNLTAVGKRVEKIEGLFFYEYKTANGQRQDAPVFLGVFLLCIHVSLIW